MALFDELAPRSSIKTIAAARRRTQHSIRGNLWILGRGDPTVTSRLPRKRFLPSGAMSLGKLIRRLKRAGINRISGGIRASTGYFRHDWNAPGWKYYFPAYEIALPSALTFNGNVHKGKHTARPELLLARTLTKRLERKGVRVAKKAGAGVPHERLREVITVRSERLWRLVSFMNRYSSNFFAEVLGKRLGVERFGTQGTIARGARAIARWARRHGVKLRAHDSSGLSYANRASPRGLARLLEAAAGAPWGDALRRGLAKGGQGTLEGRLRRVRVRAKTGTLENVSTLSGWVWLRRARTWAEFSIMSRGLDKSTAVRMENNIVKTVARLAR
jgi:D-alanyl-D-alanine carboxypeptidase